MARRQARLQAPPPHDDSPRVEEQVRRALADGTNGWWIADVLAAFDYLEPEFDYRLDEVYLHFRGSHVRYAGPVFDLYVSYDPEDTGRIRVELWSREDLLSDVEHPRALAINDVIQARDPLAALPDTRASDLPQADVRRAITTWAAQLRKVAPDVLGGTWPAGVPVLHLW